MAKARPVSEAKIEVVEIADQAEQAQEKKGNRFFFPLFLLIAALIAFLVLKQFWKQDEDDI